MAPETAPADDRSSGPRENASGGYLRRGERVGIRPPDRGDQAELAALERESAGLHRPWLPVAEPTPAAFERRLARLADPGHEGFVVCLLSTGGIVGSVNVNNIVRGSLQSGALGYVAYASTTGRGYLTEGLALVVGYAFEELGLHRLEANIQPGNTRSAALVARLGFRLEGHSPAFQRIGGEWRDHDRWALTREEPG